jgi:hypothetical protein
LSLYFYSKSIIHNNLHHMIQFLRRRSFFRNSSPPLTPIYHFLLPILLTAGLQSGVFASNHPLSATTTLSDSTTIKADICAGGFYLFGTESLDTAGTYVQTFTASNGMDSTVTLILHVWPVKTTKRTVSLCDGSFYIFKGDTLTQAGTYMDTLKTIHGCDSIVVLKLNFVPFFDIHLDVQTCTNQPYFFGGQALTQTGIYIDSLKATGGCDSTVTLNLLVHPLQPPTNLNATICGNTYYPFNGDTLTQSGTYSIVLPDVHGCDSTVVLNLTVLPVPASQITATSCEGQAYPFNGQNLIASGTYTAILTAPSGCDSIVTLQLTALPTSFTDLTAAICKGQIYTFVGQPLSIAGMYTATLAAANGCDSTVTLNLTVLPVAATQLTATICANEVYPFAGNLFNMSGIFTNVLQSANGCDSTVTLTLQVLPVFNTSQNASICAGSSFLFNGSNLTVQGDYTAHLVAQNGCDSTATLHLTVLPTYGTVINAVICANKPYVFNGTVLDTTGNYTFPFIASNGCDSTISIALTVLPVPVTHRTITLCEGSTLEFAGQILSAPGIYTDTLTSFNNCDSIVILDLKFVPNFKTEFQATICSGQSYAFAGSVFQQSGVYTDTLTAFSGCDSVLVLTLQVLPVQNTTIDASICEGSGFPYNGLVLTVPGTYVTTLTGSNGCDSIITLNLQVLPLSESLIQATICANEVYTFNGTDLDAPGVYLAMLQSANGCDSIVSLTLSVLPTLQSQLQATICYNETYNFYGSILNTSGTYEQILTSSTGCDSSVTLTLTAVPQLTTNLSASICFGTTYDFNGQSLDSSGVYQANLTGWLGCDSTVVLDLTVLPLAITELDVTICQGETYPYNNGSLSMPGVYTFGFVAYNGCDSFVTIILTVLPKSASAQVQTICEGDSYTFDNQVLTTAGTYTTVYTAANGCDSTVSLVLIVNSVQTGVTQQGGTLTSEAVNASAYQWIDCNTSQVIPSATTAVYTPQVTGNYAVQVTENGCKAQSACYFVEVVSTTEPESAFDWSIQPNPASGQVWVQVRKGPEVSSLECYDLTGRLLLRQQLHSGDPVRIDLSGLPDGTLLLKLSDGRHVASKRLTKTAE